MVIENSANLALLIKSDSFTKNHFLKTVTHWSLNRTLQTSIFGGFWNRMCTKTTRTYISFRTIYTDVPFKNHLRISFLGCIKKKKKRGGGGGGGNACIPEHGGYIQHLI